VLQKRNLSRYEVLGARSAEQFNITPRTFILPNDYVAFCEAFAKVAALLAPFRPPSLTSRACRTATRARTATFGS
jgi:hypothetical protein